MLQVSSPLFLSSLETIVPARGALPAVKGLLKVQEAKVAVKPSLGAELRFLLKVASLPLFLFDMFGELLRFAFTSRVASTNNLL